MKNRSIYTYALFTLLIFTAGCATSPMSQTQSQAMKAKAGNGRAPASVSDVDFNQMIEESQKNTSDLNAQFQKNAGIEKKVLNAGKLSDKSKEIPVEPEQYTAVSSGDLFDNQQESKRDEKAEIRRLSRELQELEN